MNKTTQITAMERWWWFSQSAFMILALALAFTHCAAPGKDENMKSEMTGITADQIVETSKPDYLKIAPKDESVTKVAVFFTYDNTRREAGPIGPEVGPYPRMPAPPPLPPGMMLADVTSKLIDDYAVVAHDVVKNWLLKGEAGDVPFLRDAKETTEGEIGLDKIKVTKLIGDSHPLGGREGAAKWQITLYLGAATSVGTALGEAMAANHITIFNGHFYGHDLLAAQLNSDSKTPGGAEGQTAPPLQQTLPGAGYPPGFFPPELVARMKSEIYGKAMETFVSKAPAHQLSYRIVVFNGCGSEHLESFILSEADKVSGSHLEIIGMRGLSNYRFFGLQVGNFLNNLANGKTWPDIVNGFKFELNKDDEQLHAQLPVKGVVPVLVNKQILAAQTAAK